MSVIIATYNAGPLLEHALDALAVQTLPAHLIEIIVVDEVQPMTRGAVSVRCRACDPTSRSSSSRTPEVPAQVAIAVCPKPRAYVFFHDADDSSVQTRCGSFSTWRSNKTLTSWSPGSAGSANQTLSPLRPERCLTLILRRTVSGALSPPISWSAGRLSKIWNCGSTRTWCKVKIKCSWQPASSLPQISILAVGTSITGGYFLTTATCNASGRRWPTSSDTTRMVALVWRTPASERRDRMLAESVRTLSSAQPPVHGATTKSGRFLG